MNHTLGENVNPAFVGVCAVFDTGEELGLENSLGHSSMWFAGDYSC